MQIYRQSPLSGKKNIREIDVTEAQLDAWQKGAMIQDVMPLLSADDREFIKTGITPEEWDEMFKE